MVSSSPNVQGPLLVEAEQSPKINTCNISTIECAQAQEKTSIIKGAVSRQFCFVTSPCLLLNFTSAQKLLVNDKITALWQTDMSPERYI